MKKIILLTLLLSSSISTFALELDFYSSESFCYESPKAQKRNGLYYLPNQQEPFTGENHCVYSNGQDHSKGNILNGLKDGKWTWWYKNGQKEDEFNFKNNNQHGKFTRWFENGQIEVEAYFKDDKADGKQTWWFINGQKSEDINWKDGKLHGEYITWNQNGNVYGIQNYKDGLRDGKMTVWHEDGRLFEWVFKDGVCIGSNSNANCDD